MGKSILILITAFLGVLIFINLVDAAIIHGTVYDTSLKKIKDAVVEINTKPEQRLVAVNGEYSFNVPKGEYIIKARYLTDDLVDLKTEEEVTVDEEGDFVFDLFLLPEVEDINETDVDFENLDIYDNGVNGKFIILIVIISVIGILVLLYVLFPKKFRIKEIKSEDTEIKNDVKDEKIENTTYSENEDTEKVINILKKEGGRVNQKDLRKLLGMSEAKMSLLIAELEHKNKVEKIKKGRGNIVILKK